ncbi:SH3 domain-binding protein 5 [Aphelenchoides avenae]|nr:SH3 domain-binding protein 5 [Aphelenchus avenae]
MSSAADVITCRTAVDATPSTSAESINSDGSKKKHERKCSSDDGIHYVDDDDGVEFALDSRHLNRVHEELEKLNIATDVINKLELQLDDARAHFREIHSTWSQRLDEMCKKYGKAIQTSRPYYEAKNEERKLREEAQAAALRFERANSMLQVAKQQVKLTQDSLNRQTVIEPECLEVLNHHIQRVSEAEGERMAAGEAHRVVSQRMIEVTLRIKQMEKDNSRSIKKSRQYFEQCMEFRRKLDQQKAIISKLEKEVKQKKNDYQTSMRNLEQISESIHEERSIASTARNSGRATPDTDRKELVVPSPRMRTSVSLATTSDISSGGSVGDEADFDDSDANSVKRQSLISEFYSSVDSHGGVIDPTALFDEELETAASVSTESTASDKKRRRPEVHGGVVLLAQQLMGGSSNGSEGVGQHKHVEKERFHDQADVRYQTKPEGIAPIPTSDYGSDASGPSLSSGRMRRSVSDLDSPTTASPPSKR